MSYNMNSVRITVLKRNIEEELALKYMKDEDLVDYGRCDLLKEGDVFICDHPFHKPEGFPCDGAWADIRNIIISVSGGMELPWIKEKNTAIASCADVLKPVLFKIERIPD